MAFGITLLSEPNLNIIHSSNADIFIQGNTQHSFTTYPQLQTSQSPNRYPVNTMLVKRIRVNMSSISKGRLEITLKRQLVL